MAIVSRIKKVIARYFVKERITPVIIPVIKGDYLDNHIAFIVGGSGGIGFSIAERFIENGCKVIISGSNIEKLKDASEKLGGNSCFITMNIKDNNSIINGIEELFKNNADVDILVNAAGVHGPSDFWSIDEEEWDKVMDINVKGVFFTSQLFAKKLRENKKKGHILNIGSASALKPGKTPYEISKNAIKSMTLGLASECIKYGIVVNCLSPGPTATRMLNLDNESPLNWSGNPSGRVARAEEIANWAVYLVSGQGDYVVGDSLYVTGGSGTICIDR